MNIWGRDVDGSGGLEGDAGAVGAQKDELEIRLEEQSAFQRQGTPWRAKLAIPSLMGARNLCGVELQDSSFDPSGKHSVALRLSQNDDDEAEIWIDIFLENG